MSIDIRPLDGTDEVERGFQVFLDAMVGLPFRAQNASELVEPGRFLGAFDDGTHVGGADSYTSWLTVPGGERIPHAAVTHIGVLPTHTRRGIVTSLVTQQLEGFAAQDEVVASLRASEAVIYERFGYAVASSATSAKLTAARAVLRATAPAPTGAAVRIVDVEEEATLLPAIYEQAAWTGAIRRPEQWWRLRQRFAAAHDGPRYVVVHSTDGVDDGYAVYEPKDTHSWFTSQQRTIGVSDLVAHTDAAHLGLLRYLLSVDLIHVIELESLALDDPLSTLFTDERAVQWGTPHDETWLRLVDVEAALNARSYRDADPVVIEIADPILPANADRYVVTPKGVTRTSAEPDLVTDVAALAATYLGGTKWWQLARSGRAQQRSAGALGRADELFSTVQLPYSGTTF